MHNVAQLEDGMLGQASSHPARPDLPAEHVARMGRRAEHGAETGLPERHAAGPGTETLYRSLFQRMQDGFAYCRAIYDDRHRAVDFRHIEANPVYSKITGTASVAGKTGSEVLAGAFQGYPELLLACSRVLATGEPETLQLTSSRACFLVSLYGMEGDFFAALFHDITAWKEAEGNFARVQGVLEGALDAISDPVMILDKEHRIVRANSAMAAKIGSSKDELAGSFCYDCMHEGNKFGSCPHARLLCDGRAHSEQVYNSSLGRHFEVTVSPLLAADGAVQGSIHFSRDITEQKRLEEQLRQSQKMEAMGTLAGGVAHDFNNILTAILGYSSILQMRLAEEEHPGLEQMNVVVDCSYRAAELTRSLLTFSRKQNVELKPTDLNEVVKKAGMILQRLVREDIEIRTELDPRPLTVLGDTGQLQQVLMNLVVNSRDATAGTGKISIATREAALDAQFRREHGYGDDGRYALLTYSDTGSGMDEETRKRIFEPFFTTKESGNGTGLGLSIVYGIVRQHNGLITCESRPGEGTRFCIYLPITSASVKTPQPLHGLCLPRGCETLLLAEDDDQARRYLKELLEEFGYQVIAAVNGEDAVRQLIRHKGEISLVVTDAVMPRLSGAEAYRRMLEVNPGLKGIIISGYPAEMTGGGDPGEAGLAFVAKPILPRELLIKIRELLR